MIGTDILAYVWLLVLVVCVVGWCSTDTTPKWIDHLCFFLWVAVWFLAFCFIIQMLCNHLVITFTWH